MQYKLFQPITFTEIGRKQRNEDYVYPEADRMTPLTRCFVLCDGMGGHQAGEVAARIVATTLQPALKNNKTEPDIMTRDRFNTALNATYNALDKMPVTEGKVPGTTMACIYMAENGVMAAHIGDSRIYQIRPGHGIIFKSQDHSLVNELIRQGQITEEEAKNHPRRNVITRAMQPRMESPCRADMTLITDVKAGDFFCICSDGVLEVIDDNTLVDILSGNRTDQQKLTSLYQLCYGKVRDNYSCILIPVASVIGNPRQVAPRATTPVEPVSVAQQKPIEVTSLDNEKEENVHTHTSSAEEDYEYYRMHKKKKGLNGWYQALIVLGIILLIIGLLFIVFRESGADEPPVESNPSIRQYEPIDDDDVDYPAAGLDPADGQPGNIIDYSADEATEGEEIINESESVVSEGNSIFIAGGETESTEPQ